MRVVHGRTRAVLLTLLTLASLPLGSLRAEESRLERELDAAIATAKNAQVALVVEDLAGKRIYARNPDALLKPASVLKLFTTAVALLRLGPDFEYKTEFYVMDNDLVIVGSGDPGLGDERLASARGERVTAVFDRLAAALKAAGITRIDRVAIDDSRFERQTRHPDWPNDQQDEWYQAPVGALNFNDNCLDATARIADGKPVIALTPNLPPEMFRNELRTTGKGPPAVVRAADSDVVRYIGVVQKGLGFEPVAMRDPTLFSGLAFKQALRDRGIAVTGDVVRRATDAETRRKAQRIHVETGTLRDALLRANTYSQNLFAECLVKTIAAYGPDGQPTGHAGGWERGAFVIRKTLAEAKLNLGDAVISDGSGLSHSNRVSAAHIVGLLQLMAKGPLAAAFRTSLAQPGQPGTMQRGYAFPSLTGGKMRAKTGTIAGVRTLAGYVRRPDGGEVAFALLINGNGGADLRTRIARILAETK